MGTIKIENINTLMIAHRGLSGLERENTIAAFIAAGNKSYYGTECDIHLTKDDFFVISHDATTTRVSPFNKVIKESTYQELLEISLYEVRSQITKPYLKIPTLKEYIEVSKKYNKQCIIEIKPELDEKHIIKLLDEIESYEYLDNVIFISFIYNNLVIIRNFNKEIRLQYLVGSFSNEIIQMCQKINIDIDINYNSLTKEIVDEFHNHGIKINVWTVDDPILGNKLISWGVDFITTNILE